MQLLSQLILRRPRPRPLPLSAVSGVSAGKARGAGSECCELDMDIVPALGVVGGVRSELLPAHAQSWLRARLRGSPSPPCPPARSLPAAAPPLSPAAGPQVQGWASLGPGQPCPDIRKVPQPVWLPPREAGESPRLPPPGGSPGHAGAASSGPAALRAAQRWLCRASEPVMGVGALPAPADAAALPTGLPRCLLLAIARRHRAPAPRPPGSGRRGPSCSQQCPHRKHFTLGDAGPR